MPTDRSDGKLRLVSLLVAPSVFFPYVLPVLALFTGNLVAGNKLRWEAVFAFVPVLNWLTLGALALDADKRSLILGACATWGVAGLLIHWAVKAEHDNRLALVRRDAEEAARAAALRVAMAALHQLLREAYSSAAGLPILLAEAELVLARAEDELKRGLYSPFWEAMEEAALKISEFHRTVADIDRRQRVYKTQAAAVRDAPPFALGVKALPDASRTCARATRLYRAAQANPHFAMVYEQRRTNEILLAGFRSLGQALDQLGDRIVTAVEDLGTSVDCRLTSVEASLQLVAASAEEQNATLRRQLEQSRGANDDMIAQMRLLADANANQGRTALRMLDNLQRGRNATVFDSP